MENAASPPHGLTARSAGLVACTRCGRVHPPAQAHCLRCGAALQSRDDGSLQRVWAWLFAGIVVYIPANVYPMLRTTSLGKITESTIVGGVIDLMHHGAYGIAAIVFIASVVIPVAKFIAIAYLALTVRHQAPMRAHGRHRLYEIVEFIGRWSMIDVFVVAILSALVQLNFAASINPGIAAVSFALSVAFTMLSAQSFDPRLIWDADLPEPDK
ncbi:paraquat-inducible protein A [Aestuariicoccus sp. MJ-SS9]|uniref:paraquat-inducible protein A n=1 Tax=Aestuariicoccus sp. MJ-SS9 TaxID=3079855 RepID=UPI0029079829|nr:paraquat-inducible protein A [Aestuariicoccus sp. MJ-SS9]MDU8913328.1 paraquat-inducible protein A [Aestuariicoccus sp. MJ-SS9]